MTTDKLHLGQELLESYRKMRTAKEMYTANPNPTTYWLYSSTKKAYDSLSKQLAKDFERCYSPDKFKDAKTSAAVVKPPVEIGDIVYFVLKGEVYKATVVLLSWTQYSDKCVRTEIRGEVCPFHNIGATWEEWNKVVFRTEEEAQAALIKKEEDV